LQLRSENEIVTQFDESLKQVTSEMLQLMYVEDGVGLAAPQIGINKRIMVFNEEGDIKRKDKEMILINPYIIGKSTETAISEEGCLSFPTIRGVVSRHIWIEVEYQDVQGNKRSCRFEDFPAVIFQHEYDHLDKVLFIDRFSSQDRVKNQAKLDKLIRKYGPGGAL
jgi:peptide deformylase